MNGPRHGVCLASVTQSAARQWRVSVCTLLALSLSSAAALHGLTYAAGEAQILKPDRATGAEFLAQNASSWE